MEISLEYIKSMFEKFDTAKSIKNENILSCHTIGLELDEETYESIENLCLINGIMYLPNSGLYIQNIEHLPSHFSRFGKEVRKYGKFEDEKFSYMWFISEFEGIMILQKSNEFGKDIIIHWKEGCSEGNGWCTEGRIIHKLIGDAIIPLDLDN